MAVLHALPCGLFLQDEEGVDPSRLFPISAVTGRGVREVVAAVRQVLDELGPAEVAPETNALNLTEAPRRFAPEVGRGVNLAAACLLELTRGGHCSPIRPSLTHEA